MKVVKENYGLKWSELIDDKLIYHEVISEYSVAFDDNGKIKNVVNASGSLVSENSEVFEYFKNKYNV